MTNDMALTQEFHVVRAHLLHYESLLEDFRKTVVFVEDTPFPGLDDNSLFPVGDKEKSLGVIQRECGSLLTEIQRLEESRGMQEKRLKNVMNLASPCD